MARGIPRGRAAAEHAAIGYSGDADYANEEATKNTSFIGPHRPGKIRADRKPSWPC